ncbi:class I adenylate-forming enzyme family protein [Rhodococcus oxybenzonivorans]|uniref:Class I adenylate-forming enzyme family protein n=2 Tax=Nocardiaceae TaxID=85025 RepID=A0AAE4UWG3_9NOCA|nr:MULTISPECIES: class I adenylate-forming enzyme family protein [Rhodococcus]MDV7243403.1 class I adenylate-forming enzyme family protein [Rhodococcus oxybenzonivorans]MDV7263897.1 class I adenylate-forming enzyme family protein [Rhodococcus oxybenzonivorans]MDV7276829.1 class I adenylate-forming enzyme family protein [Rhodococcus oxybenzonivorans]MDV7334337.1 class I adenylate-forming enzyme family protein [Rhodococcus oxybenzonivorans]MDV7344492.1 class I adenylate-forming enzyme family pro
MKQLAQEMVARAESDPDAVAVIDQLGSHTIGSIVDAARTLADRIAGIDEAPPTALIQADNTWHTLATAVAVGLRGGLVAVFSPHATEAEFELALEDIAPDIVVADPTSLSQWGIDSARFPDSEQAFDTLLLRSAPRGFGDIARWQGGTAIAMTSGSTGRPKCVVQSEEAIRYACQSTIDTVGLQPGDAIGAFVPLSSVAAFCFGMYLPAYLGGPLVAIGKWSPAGAVDAMEKNGVAWTMLVPTMALQLSVTEGSEGRLSAVRALTVGGGPMNEGALEKAETTLGTTFLRVFGMSECLGHTTPALDDPPAVRLGRDGRPFPCTIVRAVDSDGLPVPTGEIGDAQVKGPSMFVGYARGGIPVPPTLTQDGFLPTGDLVEVGNDGTVQVIGRKKQIIIRGGRNIDVNEMESAIADLPGVVQVCVVPVPDDLLGERAAALVVTECENLTLERVTEQLAAANFPKFKWPEYVFTVDDLPQNRVGKLSRPDAVSMASTLATKIDPNSPQGR